MVKVVVVAPKVIGPVKVCDPVVLTLDPLRLITVAAVDVKLAKAVVSPTALL